MININQAIIVEGKHDKIKLSSIVNTTIITTDGFGIFKNKNKINLIKRLADKSGIIILTDSDTAGFQIRKFLSGIIDNNKITNIYIPPIVGKERRKSHPSKEGILGVEGVNNETIINILDKFKINDKNEITNKLYITHLDLFEDGLIGNKNSYLKRQDIISKLNLPKYLSTKSLINVLNKLLTFQEYKNIINK